MVLVQKLLLQVSRVGFGVYVASHGRISIMNLTFIYGPIIFLEELRVFVIYGLLIYDVHSPEYIA